jgi:hypothetical protein
MDDTPSFPSAVGQLDHGAGFASMHVANQVDAATNGNHGRNGPKYNHWHCVLLHQFTPDNLLMERNVPSNEQEPTRLLLISKPATRPVSPAWTASAYLLAQGEGGIEGVPFPLPCGVETGSHAKSRRATLAPRCLSEVKAGEGA